MALLPAEYGRPFTEDSRKAGLLERGAAPRDRFRELDSLRGIAAVTVVLCHLLDSAPAINDRPGELWALKYTPLHIFWAGHQAVLFFFVLSGFVLALPFCSGPVSYRAFLAKRVLRICVPYWVAVLIAAFAYHSFGHHRVVGLSSWFDRWWNDPLSYQMLLNHVLLIGSFRNNVLDPVLWSLVHEMRISLVFPLLMAFLLRHKWGTTLLAAAALAVIGIALQRVSLVLGHENDYGESLRYVLLFVIGALLCRHRSTIVGRFQSLPALSGWGCLLLAVLAYTYPFWLLPSVHVLHAGPVDDLVTSVGVAAFIVVVLACRRGAKALMSAPLGWLGKVSYSLYLFHAIALLTLLNLLSGLLPLWSIWTLTVLIALPLSVLGQRLLEQPSIAMGQRLAGLVSEKRSAAEAGPRVPQEFLHGPAPETWVSPVRHPEPEGSRPQGGGPHTALVPDPTDCVPSAKSPPHGLRFDPAAVHHWPARWSVHDLAVRTGVVSVIRRARG